MDERSYLKKIKYILTTLLNSIEKQNRIVHNFQAICIFLSIHTTNALSADVKCAFRADNVYIIKKKNRGIIFTTAWNKMKIEGAVV